MAFISYAQNFEDVMLWRALGHIEKGFYIDVGANDPIVDSVTKAFYNADWSGINIEPISEHIETLKLERPRDINLAVAAGNVQSTAEIIQPTTRGWASLNPVFIEKYTLEDQHAKRHVVNVTTLNHIIREYCTHQEIHFLKIDVEGFELQVLQGITLSRYRPWIIVIESTLPNSQIESYKSWEKILRDNQYLFAYFDGLNRYYIAKEHNNLKKHFKTPPNVFDNYIRYREIELLNQIELLENKVKMLEER